MTVQMPIEDRLALQDLMTAYCYAVDDIGKIEPLLDIFTDDAVLDFRTIGLPLMNGKGDIRAFFEGVFADMSHHAHYITNFRPEAYDGDTAAMSAYVIGMGRANDGNEVVAHVRYRFECLRTDAGWKCNNYSMVSMMPVPESIAEIHGER